MRKVDIRNTIAKNTAKLLENVKTVNLGIGIPTLVPNYIHNTNILLQSENGVLGVGSSPKNDEEKDEDYFDAGSSLITLESGGSFVDSSLAFGLIRSGRIDATVLGALQVDQNGNIANWSIPNKLLAGYGGAMDLVTGCPLVIVAMEHTNRGNAKILKKCTFPLTGASCVNYVVTELGIIECIENRMVLKEIGENVELEEIKEKTDADLIIDDDLKTMEIIYEN